jgi:hypothetical protein
MEKNHWMVGGFGGALGLAMALAFAVALQSSPPEVLPHVSAGIPASEIVDLTDRHPIERILPAEAIVYYQYVDEDGAVQFSSTLHEVPEAWRDRAGRFELAGMPPSTPAEARMHRKLDASRTVAGR